MWERQEIEVFLTLAEELHFGRTAERLYVTTGLVSKTLKKLELRIGAPLFDRTSRNVALTPLGQRLANELAPAQAQLDGVIRRAADQAQGLAGEFRVGYSAPWNGDLLLRAGNIFMERHPGSTVSISEIQLSDPLGPLRAGDVELQLTEWPIDEPDVTRGPLVAAEPRALIVPRGHAFAARASVDRSDLADAPLITVEGEIPLYWLDHHYPRTTRDGRPIERGPSARYWQEVLALVAGGAGVSITCSRAAAYYGHPEIVYVPFSDAPPIEYGLLWLRSSRAVRMRALSEIVEEVATTVRP